ncbi:hypothetical protein [Acetobacter ascendens]|uniref:hypothetical protein n=1 Tax=Acetobacter ascendens TaxID=481146 RepID=UPI000875EA48|nr:hypothetical protein [Acetobacter ascendens]AOW49401.1 hypothetical protein A4R89_08215 [Acetobacter ascendens]
MSNDAIKIEKSGTGFVLIGSLNRVSYSMEQEARSGSMAVAYSYDRLDDLRKETALKLVQQTTNNFIADRPSISELSMLRDAAECLITISIAEMRKAAGASEGKQSSDPEMDHATPKSAEPDAHYGRAPCLSVSDCWLQPEKDGSRLQLIAHGTGLDITDFVTNMLFGSQVIPVRFSVSGKIKDDRLFEASEVNPEYASGRSLPVRQLRLSIPQPAKSV